MEAIPEYQKIAQRACRLFNIPKDLWEDAEQEAWCAQAEGVDIMTHLGSWWRKERLERKRVQAFSRPRPHSKSEMLELRKAVEETK